VANPAVKIKYLAVPVPGNDEPGLADAVWLATVQQIARERGITLTDLPHDGGGSRGRGGAEPPARAGKPPSPRGCQTVAEFLNCMRRLKIWAGDPSLRELEARAKTQRRSLPHSTLGRALNPPDEALPGFRTLYAFVHACGASRYWREWSKAWAELRYRPVLDIAPPSGESPRFEYVFGPPDLSGYDPWATRLELP